MIRFPNAKINLGLRVLSRRQDGYHDIETIMLPIGLYEALEVIADDTDNRPGLSIPGLVHHFARTGVPVPCIPDDDLVIQACRLFSQHTGERKMKMPPVSIHLHKCIPPGSGLGGGSADAVFMLRILAGMAYGKKADRSRIKKKLLSLAFKLGSDCPFFLYNEPAQVLGRGEIVKPVNIPAIKQLSLVLIIPPVHVSTTAIYQHVMPHRGSMPLTDCIREQPDNWKDLIINDFEPIVFRMHPTIKKIRDSLYGEGAVFASMSGTGSAIYGLFRGQPDKGLKKALQLEKNVAFLLLSNPG